MNLSFRSLLKVSAVSLLVGLALVGCESTEGGGGNVSASMYYGVGFYDPWYYGGYYNDVDVIVTPPGNGGGGGAGSGARPSHPIATPPVSTTRPTPMPSIPSMPRVSPRR